MTGKERTTPATRLLGTPPGAAQKPRGGPGRPKGDSPDETHDRIPNAAERLFSQRGGDGASIRDVAEAAHAQINAVGNRLGPKKALFDVLVARCATIMNEWRLRALAMAWTAAGDLSILIETLVRATVRPFIESASHGEPGWRNYAALMARLANSPLRTEIIARQYDDMARAYLDEFRRKFANVTPDEVAEGCATKVAATLGICADTGRRERLAGTSRPRPTETSVDVLVRFHGVGFKPLSGVDGV